MRFRRVLLALFVPTSVQLALGYPWRALAWLAALTTLQLAIRSLGPWAYVLVVAWMLAQLVDAIRLWPRREPRRIEWPLLALVIWGSMYAEAKAIEVYWLDSFAIWSSSNIPSILPGDQIYVDKLAKQPRRGELIAFRLPTAPRYRLISRVVALGGDTVEMRDSLLIVNGRPVERRAVPGDCRFEAFIEEAWLERRCTAYDESFEGRSYRVVLDEESHPRSFRAVTVPPGAYFVLGDNRDDAWDSRLCDSIPAAFVEGTVRSIWWSAGPHGTRWQRINQRVN